MSGAVGALLALVAVFAGVEPVQAPQSPPLIRIEIPSGAEPGTTKIVLMGPTKDKPVRARPKGGAVAAIFSSDDYPAEALRKGETGLTVVETSIDAKGAVIGCKVVESSGSSALDAATCKIIRDVLSTFRRRIERAVRLPTPVSSGSAGFSRLSSSSRSAT